MNAPIEAAAMQPRVYIVILNYRGWRDTIECLESVFRQRYGNFRVLLCDNGSPDDSVERIRAWSEGSQPAEPTGPDAVRALTDPPIAKPFPLVEYDREVAERGGDAGVDAPLVLIHTGGNLGFAAGNNVGIRYAFARGDVDYVWLLNNDTVIDPDALTAMVARAESDPSIGMVGSKLLYYDEPERVQAIGGGHLTGWKGLATHVGADERDDGRWTEPLEMDVIIGASLLVPRRVIERIGEMDEGYFIYSEELDWCWTARKAGWKLVYAPGSVVWHKVSRTMGQRSPVQDYHATRGTLRFAGKHFPRLMPATFVYGIYRILLPKLVRVQPARARAVLRAYRDHLRRAPRPGGA